MFVVYIFHVEKLRVIWVAARGCCGTSHLGVADVAGKDTKVAQHGLARCGGVTLLDTRCAKRGMRRGETHGPHGVLPGYVANSGAGSADVIQP